MSGNRKYQQLSLQDLERLATVYSVGVTNLDHPTPQDYRTADAIREAIARAHEIQKQTTKPVRVCLAYSVQRSAQLTMIPPANVKALSRK